MDRPECELPRKVSLRELDKHPVTLEVVATEAECAAIAERLSVDAVLDLKGTVTLSLPSDEEAMIHKAMFDGQVVMAKGFLQARVSQTCVVTLEAIENNIESSFDGIFTNDEPDSLFNEDSDESEDLMPDILGPIGEDAIEAGTVFIEQLALEIDPFPRKQGVEFEGFSSNQGDSDDDKKESPFAVLEKLKDNL